MQTKATLILLLAAGALMACAGCHHDPAPMPPEAHVPTPPSQVTPAAQGANSALTNPNTPPDVKKYLQEHQSQINQSQSKPAGQ